MPRESNVNVTIRHAGHAFNMLLDGGIRQIESAFPDHFEITPEQQEALNSARTGLFDSAAARLLDWEIPGCWIVRAEGMISDMQEMLGQPDCPNVVRELLAKFNMEP